MRERHVYSIPPLTTLDAVRKHEAAQRKRPHDPFGGRLSFGEPRQGSQQELPGESAEGFNIKDHVFQKPADKRPKIDLTYPDGRITWNVETIEFNGLLIIAQLSGIDSSGTLHFERSRRDYGQDNVVFFAPVKYKKSPAYLIFATHSDIFETQVVPQKKDVSPFFREEIYCPRLLTHYVPASMRPSYNNGIYTVKYSERGLANI